MYVVYLKQKNSKGVVSDFWKLTRAWFQLKNSSGVAVEFDVL